MTTNGFSGAWTELERRFPGAWLGAAVVLLVASGCRQQASDAVDTYPRKPIKVVVPVSAGGGSDSFVRIVQKAVRDEQLLSQPLVVINVPGAGGTVGSRRVRQATPDGHTILCLHEGILSSKFAGRIPFGPEAFRPIAATGQSSLVVCVRENSSVADLAALMAMARDQPDQVRFGMAQGTPTHFVGRKLESAGGDDSAATFRYVSSGGGAKRFNDLVGGHIDATPFSLAEYAKFRENGVRALAVLGLERSPAAPTIPTAREQGFDVVMRHVQYWWAPRSTPTDAVATVADALEAAMATDYVRGKLAQLKIEPLFLRDQALQVHLADRRQDFQDVALVRFDGLPNLTPVVLVLVLAFSVLALCSARAGKRWPARDADAPAWRGFVICSAGLAAYVLVMQVIDVPYAVATAAFVPLMGVAAGARSGRSITGLAITGVCLGWACSVIFTRLLVIDLP